ncbi:hypothetical protein D3C84_801040 [compost metagenome]
MRSTTSDHSAQRDDCIELSLFRNDLRSQWQLKSAWHLDDFDLFVIDAMSFQNLDSAAHKVLNNEAVEPTHNDCVSTLYVSKPTFNYLHTHDRSYKKRPLQSGLSRVFT